MCGLITVYHNFLTGTEVVICFSIDHSLSAAGMYTKCCIHVHIGYFILIVPTIYQAELCM